MTARVLFFLLIFQHGHAQVRCFFRIAARAVELKWFHANVVSRDTFILYRSACNASWERLGGPFYFDPRSADSRAEAPGSTTRAMVSLAGNAGELKGAAKLALLLRMISDQTLCDRLAVRYADTGVVKGQAYVYRLARRSAGNERTEFLSAEITAGREPAFDPPTGIDIRRKGRSIGFSWRAEPMRYYGVDIYRSGNGSFEKLNRIPLLAMKGGEGPRYLDKDLKPGCTYRYFLRARDFFDDHSLPSDTFTFLIPDDSPPMPPPRPLVSVRGKSITIQWKPYSDPECSRLIVERAHAGDSVFAHVRLLMAGKDSLCSDVAENYGLFRYRLCAEDSSGNTACSPETLADVYDNDPPAPPQNIKATPDTGQIVLSWDKSASGDVRGYLVFGSVAGYAAGYSKVTPSAVATLSFVHELPKEAGNDFTYRIVAVDSSDNHSGYSGEVTARMPDVVAPRSPLLLRVDREGGTHVIRWIRNADPDLSEYALFRLSDCDTPAVFSRLNRSGIHPAQDHYTDRWVVPGCRYRYYAVAMDSALNVSLPSNVLSRKFPSLNRTTLSVSLKCRRRSSMCSIQWQLSDTTAPERFIVYRKGVNGERWETVAAVRGASSLSMKRSPGYFFQVRAYFADGRVVRSQTLRHPD